MTPEDFDGLVDNRFDRCKAVLKERSALYAAKGDRLWNFKSAAKFKDCTPEEALHGFVMKHLTAVKDAIDQGLELPLQTWEELVTDIINYHVLLEGLVKDIDDA